MLARSGRDEPLGEAVIAGKKISRIVAQGDASASECPRAHALYLKNAFLDAGLPCANASGLVRDGQQECGREQKRIGRRADHPPRCRARPRWAARSRCGGLARTMRFPNVPFNLTGFPPRDDDLTGARARRAKAASCLTSGATATDTFPTKKRKPAGIPRGGGDDDARTQL